MSDDGDEIPERTQADPVAWRLEQAMRLGVPFEDAERFAVSRADLERLRMLVGRGCEPWLAIQILL